MNRKLAGKTLAKFEVQRDVRQEVLEAVRETKAGGGKWTTLTPKLSGNIHELKGASRSSKLQ